MEVAGFGAQFCCCFRYENLRNVSVSRGLTSLNSKMVRAVPTW